MIKSEAKPRQIWSKCDKKCGELKSSPVIGGFEMSTQTSKSPPVRRINFDPVQGLNSNFDPVLGLDQHTSSGIQYYHVSNIKQYGWLIYVYSWIINTFEIHEQKTFLIFLVCPPSGNMARKKWVSWFAHLNSRNMARKECFLVCPPSGNMVRKQCMLGNRPTLSNITRTNDTT